MDPSCPDQHNPPPMEKQNEGGDQDSRLADPRTRNAGRRKEASATRVHHKGPSQGSVTRVTRVFFDTMITYNDHPSYVKHVLGRIYMFFT